MKREALEAHLNALMDEATRKKKETPAKEIAPHSPPRNAKMAALVVGGALIGALISGLLYRPVAFPPALTSEESVVAPDKDSNGDSVLFYIGFGRIRK